MQFIHLVAVYVKKLHLTFIDIQWLAYKLMAKHRCSQQFHIQINQPRGYCHSIEDILAHQPHTHWWCPLDEWSRLENQGPLKCCFTLDCHQLKMVTDNNSYNIVRVTSPANSGWNGHRVKLEVGSWNPTKVGVDAFSTKSHVSGVTDLRQVGGKNISFNLDAFASLRKVHIIIIGRRTTLSWS